MNALNGVLTSRRVNRLLPWIAAAVLLAGIITFLAVHSGNTVTRDQSTPAAKPSKAPTVATNPKSVPLSPAAREVAGKFILTAVQRKNLAAAWKISGPGIRQDLTYREWLKGDIPVVPFLKTIDKAPLKVDESHRNDALLEIVLIPKKGKGQYFFIGLKKIGKGPGRHWVVDSWVPRSAPQIPRNPGG